LGVFWPALYPNGTIAYELEGEHVEVQAFDRGTWSLGASAPLPWEKVSWPWLDPEATYRYEDGEVVPAEISFSYGRQLVRTAIQWGAPLPAMASWKAVHRPIQADVEDFFPSAGEEAFHIGVSFEDAYREIAGRDGKARAVVESGCARFVVYHGGGSAVVPLLLEATDEAAFQLSGWGNRGTYGGWELTYAAESGPSGTGGTWQEWESDAPEGLMAQCTGTRPGSGLGPTAFMQAAWRIPSAESGRPCGLESAPRNIMRDGNWTLAGRQFTAHLFYSAEDNTGRWEPALSPDYFSDGELAADVVTGEWERIRLTRGDMDVLESEAWQEQPLPLPIGPDDLTSAHYYRCVQPELRP
jgi:hypothetical protein